MRIVRKKWFAVILVTALLTMAFGWPLSRGVVSLFWSVYIADADSDVDLAADRIADRYPGLIKYVPDRPVLIPKWQGRDCYLELFAANRLPGRVDRTAMDVRSALRQFGNNMDAMEVYRVEHAALVSVPRPLLGILSGCIEASPFTQICDGYARDLLANAIGNARRDLRGKFDHNAMQLSEMSCVVADGMNARMRMRANKA